MDFSDGQGVAIGFAVIAALLLGPIAFFRVRGLPKRLAELERQVGELALTITQLQPGPLAAIQPPAMDAVPVSVPAALPPLPAVSPEMPAVAVSETAKAAPPPPAEPVPPPAGFQSLPPPVAAPAQRSLEERLGAGWTVWVGGIALALGGLLLVRYSLENGLIGPFVRVLLGLALAAVLAILGEILRRRDDGTSEIPAVLTAAGTVAAFGSIYAAHALYGFIGPAVAFAALGGTGLLCLLLAGLHGPWLAGLGLVGSLAVPLLVESRAPDPWTVVGFVGVVCATAYALARVRNWMILALASFAGAGVWGLALAIGADSNNMTAFSAGLLHDCLHIVLAGAVFGLPRKDEVRQVPLSLGATASLLPSLMLVPALLALVAGMDRHFGQSWIIWAAAPLLMLTLLARMLPVAAGAFAAAALGALAIVAIWPDAAGNGLNVYDSPGAYPAIREFQLFLGFCGGSAAIIAVFAARGLFGGPAVHAAISLFQGGTACLLPLAMLVLVWFRVDHAVAPFSAKTFAAWAGGLALVDVAMAAALRRRSGSAARLGLGCFAAAAIAALSLALVFALDRGMLTVGLALAAAGTALVAVRLNIPALRWCVAALGLLIAARLAWDTRIVEVDIGKVPVFNWLLYGYGVPALSFIFAAWLLRRARADVPLQVSQALAIVFSALLVFFEIRHGLNHGDAFAKSSSMIEQGLMAVSSLGFAIIMTQLDLARAGMVFRVASILFGLASLATTLGGLGLWQNPYLTDEVIEGGKAFNALLLAYGLPGAMALLLARLSRGIRPEWYRLCAAFVALFALFGMVSLEVRRWFIGPQIGFWRGFEDIEWYAYSAVWLTMGLVLLAWGIWRKSVEARLVSGLFVLAAVFKIFLFDLAGLDGILRALSFIGLGFVLIGIGLTYQKLVFKPRA